jgi:hypothetical protein
MAAAYKNFDYWVEPETTQRGWARQQSNSDLNVIEQEDTVVIKQSAYSRSPSLVLPDDSSSWVRMSQRQRHILPANRDDPNHNSIEAQVEELRQHSQECDERFSEESAREALRFCHELAADCEPAIFLLANGNLRAVWRNEDKDQIGIQFMPNGLVQYVILRDREGLTLKALGEDLSHDKVRHTVEVQELMGLWFYG